MMLLLLALIYLAFISLGLPDALLGAAWPTMYPFLGVPIAYAGVLSMIIAGSTIASSLNMSRLSQRFGTGLITAISVLLTAVALFGFSFSTAFYQLCLWSIPYGLGAGAVDAALNHFVARHYSAKHMSWLHCFWGVGASIGPYIMGYALVSRLSWQLGYQWVGSIQMVLVIVLLASLPLWRKHEHTQASHYHGEHKHLSVKEALGIKGVAYILLAFMAYCGLETTAGLWASSYMVLYRHIQPDQAAQWAALFYLGITLGRFLSGFITERFGNLKMIRIGMLVIGVGIMMMLIPVSSNSLTFLSLIVVGLGCAPIYPSIIHETPRSFGAENAQAIIGIQMASAYTGSTLIPPIFGAIAQYVGISMYPVFLFALLGLVWTMSERKNRILS